MSDTNTTPAVIEVAIDSAGAQGAIQATDTLVETKPIEQPTEPAKIEAITDNVSAKFAALSRKEKEIRAREKAIRQLEAELKTKQEVLETDVKGKYIDPEDFKKNPYKYMQQHGLTLEQVAEIILNDGKETPEKMVSRAEEKVNKRIAELEAKLAEKDAQAGQEQLQRVQQEFVAGLTNLVNEGDSYELIRANDMVDAVYDVIERTYEERYNAFVEENDTEPTIEERNGFILSNKDACDAVESYLLAEAKKYTATKKVQGLVTPKPTTDQNVKESKTLTNDLAAQSNTTSGKRLTEEERFSQVASMIKWE